MGSEWQSLATHTSMDMCFWWCDGVREISAVRCMGEIGHAFSRIHGRMAAGDGVGADHQYMRSESLTCAAIWRGSLETDFLGT